MRRVGLSCARGHHPRGAVRARRGLNVARVSESLTEIRAGVMTGLVSLLTFPPETVPSRILVSGAFGLPPDS